MRKIDRCKAASRFIFHSLSGTSPVELSQARRSSKDKEREIPYSLPLVATSISSDAGRSALISWSDMLYSGRMYDCQYNCCRYPSLQSNAGPRVEAIVADAEVASDSPGKQVEIEDRTVRRLKGWMEVWMSSKIERNDKPREGPRIPLSSLADFHPLIRGEATGRFETDRKSQRFVSVPRKSEIQCDSGV